MTTILNTKRLVIIGGGTNTYVSNHLALSAPAYGTTATNLFHKFSSHPENKMEVDLYLTDMCTRGRRGSYEKQEALDTPEEVEILIDKLIADPDTRVIIFNVTMVDFKPTLLTEWRRDDKTLGEDSNIFGKYNKRISTSGTPVIDLELRPYDKIINKIRKERKDILLVGFKTTCGATKEEQYNKGLKLCKEASANIVFVNDVDKDRIKRLNHFLNDRANPEEFLERSKDNHIYHHGSSLTEDEIKHIKLRGLNQLIDSLQNNGLVTPEESSYWYDTRDEALDGLVQMVLDRSDLQFSQSTVVDSEAVPWNLVEVEEIHKYMNKDLAFPLHKKHYNPNPIIPESFRAIFNFIRSSGGWHEGPTGNTSGHFGFKVSKYESICSIRKQNYNKIEDVGMVRVITDDPDDVFGYKHFFEDKYTQTVNQINELEIYLSKLKIWDRCRQETIDLIKELKYSLFSLKREDKVITFGAKPSVGDVTQRQLFKMFFEYNCVIHFHSSLKPNTDISLVSQFKFECGSFQCGLNTVNGMKKHILEDGSSIMVVHIDHHGPNIMFNSKVNPQLVINFIDKYWDLSRKTDGLSKDNI